MRNGKERVWSGIYKISTDSISPTFYEPVSTHLWRLKTIEGILDGTVADISEEGIFERVVEFLGRVPQRSHECFDQQNGKTF